MSNEEKKAGKSWLSSIASFVVESDEKPAAAQTPAQPQPQAMAAPAVPGQPVQYIAPLPINSMAPDPDMIAQLRDVVAKKPSAYSAFLEQAATFESIIPDETMRLRAAIASVLKSGSRTFEQISGSIDMHIADVEGQRVLFKGVSDQRRRTEVDAPKQRADQLHNQNVQIAQQIEQRQQEIQRLQEQAAQNDTETNQLLMQSQAAEADIGSVENRFGLSVDFVKNELAAKKQLLSTVGAPAAK